MRFSRIGDENGHSTRFKRSLVVLIFLAITALVSSSLYSFQTRGYVYDQLLEHNHSPAYADNGYDASFLQSSSGICSDCLISSCDYTANGYKAEARAWNNGHIVQTVVDPDGAYGQCSQSELVLNKNGNIVNAGSHDECRDRNGNGCGPNSNHGS